MDIAINDPALSDAHKRLENWGRWAGERRASQTASLVRSAERHGRVKSGRGGPIGMPVDGGDASLVDRALAPVSGFPWHYARLLRAAYAWDAPREVVARVSDTPIRDLDRELLAAIAAAGERIDRLERAERARLTSARRA